MSTDKKQRFQIAIRISDLKTAHEIAVKLDTRECWRTLGKAYMACGDAKKAVECFVKCEDYPTSFLIATSAGLHTQVMLE